MSVLSPMANQGFHTLEKGELDAMKEGTDIVFVHNETDNPDGPFGKIVIIKDSYQNTDGWSGSLKTQIEVPSYIEKFGKSSNANSGFSSHRIYEFGSTTLHSVIYHVIRTGDAIRLQWRLNGTQYLDKQGIAMDDLVLQIRRTTRAGRVKDLQFVIDTEVGPVDGIARMIRNRSDVPAVWSLR